MEESCKVLNLVPNIYDISFYGKFDLFSIDQEQKRSLSDICRNKTIVVMNDIFIISSSQ